jgi:amino acid transporter
MEKEGCFRAILRLMGLIALVALGILIVVTIIGLLLGWRAAAQFGGGFIWGGVAATALGVFGTMGSWGLDRDATQMYVQSASHQSLHERTGRSLRDSLRSYNLGIVALVAGILCILVGSLIQTI